MYKRMTSVEASKELRTHFKTDFEARLSDTKSCASKKLVGKAGGKKGSEAY